MVQTGSVVTVQYVTEKIISEIVKKLLLIEKSDWNYPFTGE